MFHTTTTISIIQYSIGDKLYYRKHSVKYIVNITEMSYDIHEVKFMQKFKSLKKKGIIAREGGTRGIWVVKK